METNVRNKQFHLNPKQVRALIKLADFRRGDVFYDFGCGEGQVVIEVAKQTLVRKAVGLENDKKSYEVARRTAVTTLQKSQLLKADFWYGNMTIKDPDPELWQYFYDVTDATIVYYSLEEELSDIKFLKEITENKRLRVVKKDLPFVGFNSIPNRDDDDCWFFLMKFPLKPIKTRKAWSESVIGRKDVAVNDVYEYYEEQLRKRKAYRRRDVTESILGLKALVNRRF